jgi:uracil-DNA glycosylase family 4
MSCWCDGSPEAPLMIVGMAPGREELESDRPFTGPAGRLLWSMLKRAGYDRADTYILNIIGEWPQGSTGGPTQTQLSDWWDRFDSAVADFRGRVALVLGGDAFSRFTGLDGGINAWGGYLLPASERRAMDRSVLVHSAYKTNTKTHKKGDPRIIKTRQTTPPPPFDGLIIPALHPAGVLRTGLATAPILNSQIQKVGRALRAELKPARSTYATYGIYWSSPKAVAVDIETGGISHGITRLGCANDRDGFSIPWSATARDLVRTLLAGEGTTALFHNGGFDIPRLAGAGAPVAGPVFDTMLAAALLQPDLPKGLNAAASLYLDCPRWKHLDEDEPAKYNAIDAIRTYELWEVENELLQSTGQHALFTGRIMPALPTLIRMGTTGIRLDEVRRAEWVTELRNSSSTLLTEWSARTNGCSPNSPMQLKSLFRSLGMDTMYNKDGGESVDAMALSRLRTDYPEHAPLLDLLQSVKRSLKDLETYALVPVGGDGRVHPSFVPAYKDEDLLGKGIAGTWRITAKEPNLFNQPTRARRIYCPSPGMCFVGADFAQQEARILGWLSGDKVLLSDCDGDIHARNAERLGIDKVRAKNAFYGWSYLAGGRTLQNTFAAKGYNLSLRECESLLAGFDSTYHAAAAYRHRVLATAQAQRYVENPFGLRRYFPHQKFPAPSAMSTLIQSTGAVILWTIVPQLEKLASRFNGNLLLTVYDDVLMEVPVEHEAASLAGIVDIMQQEFPEIAPGFTCPASPKASHSSWGEMTDCQLTA